MDLRSAFVLLVHTYWVRRGSPQRQMRAICTNVSYRKEANDSRLHENGRRTVNIDEYMRLYFVRIRRSQTHSSVHVHSQECIVDDRLTL